MNRELLESLVRCSAELQAAYARARAAGREDIAQRLREAAVKVAASISRLATNKSAEVVS